MVTAPQRSFPTIGEKIDRYRIINEWQSGGMATVYAVHRGLGTFDKLLAMKIMHPHLASEERFVSLFLDEARIAALIQHPNVVQLFDVGTHSGSPYLVMEFLRGQSLAKVINKTRGTEPGLSQSMFLSILASVADGLHAAHEARGPNNEVLGVVHRDMSYQNVIVTYDGHVKVVDFGIAYAAGRITQTKTGELRGKLTFMAPEQIDKSAPMSPQTDLWALGVMAWEVYSGESLFRGENDAETLWNVMNKEVPDIGTLVENIPDDVADLIMDCLNRTPHRRPESASQLAELLRAEARKMGGASTADIAALMQVAFREERAREDEIIGDAMRQFERLSGRFSTGTSLPEATEKVRAATELVVEQSRSRLVLGLLAAGLVLGGLLALTLGGDDDSATSPAGESLATSAAGLEPTVEPLAAPPPPDAAPVPDAPPDATPAPPDATPEPPVVDLEVHTITLRVDPRTRLALVNDVAQRSWSPLKVDLIGDEKAAIRLLGPGNLEKVFEVDREDDGKKLLLPKIRRSSTPKRKQTTSRDKDKNKSPLVDVPIP